METPVYNPNGVNVEGITWALNELPRNAQKYALARRYYDGDHDLQFATQRWRNVFGRLFRQLKLNLCPVLVDTPKARLRIEKWEFDNQLDDEQEETLALPPDVVKTARRLERRAAEVWRRNRMQKRAGEVHGEALTTGDSYVLVWPNAQGQATFYPHLAGTVAVEHDPENPGHLVRGAKAWLDKGFVRLTLYYCDRIEKYISAQKASSLPSGAYSFVPYIERDASGLSVEPWPLANPYGKVPIFHFANNAAMGASGQSEINPLCSVQDALNKSIKDMMVAMEYASYRQRYATGVEMPTDPVTGAPYNPFEAGADRLWHIEDQNAKFGEFSESDIAKFLEVKRGFQADMALVARIPLHYFTLRGGDVPSGDALELLDSPFADKVLDRQTAFGCTWADAMRLALEIEGESGASVSPQWCDAHARTELSRVTVIAKKRTDLGISQKQSWREAGYSDAEITRMETEKSDESQSLGSMMGSAFLGGGA